MKLNIVCCGKIKEKYYLEAQSEYVKMLSRFCDVKIVELTDEPLTAAKSAAQEAAVLQKEAQRLTPKLSGYVIAMCVEGERMDSVRFSEKLSSVMCGGDSEITFVIGSSLGLAPEIKKSADMRLSVSQMTLPHRLFRVVLLEQIYRAFKIMNGETYHK